MIHAIDNVEIAVSDLETSLRFYRRLGFEPEYQDESGAMIKAGTAYLYLFVTPNQPGGAIFLTDDVKNRLPLPLRHPKPGIFVPQLRSGRESGWDRPHQPASRGRGRAV